MGPQVYRILKFVIDSFGLESICLAEGSILDPCIEILRCESNYITYEGVGVRFALGGGR